MVTDVPGRFDAKCRAVREHPRLNFPDENAPAPKRVEHAPTSSKYRGVANSVERQECFFA